MRRRDGKEPEGAQRPRRHRAPDLPVSPHSSHHPLRFPSTRHTASGPEHPLQTARPVLEPAPPGFHWPFHPARRPHSPLEVLSPGRPSHTEALSCNPGYTFHSFVPSLSLLIQQVLLRAPTVCGTRHNEPPSSGCSQAHGEMGKPCDGGGNPVTHGWARRVSRKGKDLHAGRGRLSRAEVGVQKPGSVRQQWLLGTSGVSISEDRG